MLNIAADICRRRLIMKLINTIISSLLFVLLWTGQAISQQSAIRFDWITSENTLIVKGLSQNTIYCLIQDSQGFMWIGTWDGLNKYDGYNFTVYNTEDGLTNPTIYSVVEDEEDKLWIGTDNGLNLLNRQTGKIVQYYHQAGNSNSLSNNLVSHIYKDSEGILWISSAYGLDRYDVNQNAFTYINFFERSCDSSFSNFITRVRPDSNGLLWIATHHGIHSMNAARQDFCDYKLLQDVNAPEYVRSNYVQDIAIDLNGLIYAATLNGVFIIKPGFGVIHHLVQQPGSSASLSSNQVNALLIDKKGLVWIGTSHGLDLYDPVSKQMTNFKAGTNITNLSNDNVTGIFQDQAGAIWIGTYRGLNKVDSSPSRFLHYQNEPDDQNSLTNNIVYAFTEDKAGRVWIGTYGGVNVFDRVKETFDYIPSDPENPSCISSYKIRTLAIDSSGFVWVGTESSGMNRINPATGKISQYQHYPENPASLSSDNILSTFVDSKGRVWIGTVEHGVNIFDPKTGAFEILTNKPESRLVLSDSKIWDVYQDHRGNFWIGTNAGLNTFNANFDSLVIYRYNPADDSSISSDRIFSIYQDSDGIFWIGTMGGGLNRFDPETGKFTRYNESDGLPNNVVYSTLDDGEGNLWISTNWGLSKFDKHTGAFVNYDTKDGVQGNEFNANAYLTTRSGEMYFGGMCGFNVFHPDEITLNKVPPTMAFTGLRVLNALLTSELEDGEIIRLRYDENFFSIEFSALDYTNPPKNMYRYKLENYDDDWIIAPASQRRAEYRKVSAGTYRFRVTGSNNDGVWNEDGISLTIIIRPPWWETWIFRISLALVLILLFWGFILFRIKTIRKRHEVDKKMLSIEKQVFELEQKALRLQMNPHFMFNSLNAIQNFVLSNDTDKAVNYLAKFSHLMRMILANSTAALITLKDELKSLTYYIDLERLRFDDKFEYAILRDPSIDEEFVEIPPMLFQPYVENAIIHGLVNSPKPGMLEIAIKQVSKGVLLCSIKDNGIGREKATAIRNSSGIKRQPRGMVITQERIEIFNEQNRKNFSVKITDLKDENGEATGTLVEFTIQYKEI
jgi:ligand-binding sensor domain-containing protein